MPTQALLQQLYDMMDKSPVIQDLPKERIEKLKKKYEKVSDAQVKKGIEIVKNSDAKRAAKEAEKEKKAKESAENRLKEQQRLRQMEIKEQREDEAEAEKILLELENIG